MSLLPKGGAVVKKINSDVGETIMTDFPKLSGQLQVKGTSD